MQFEKESWKDIQSIKKTDQLIGFFIIDYVYLIYPIKAL